MINKVLYFSRKVLNEALLDTCRVELDRLNSGTPKRDENCRTEDQGVVTVAITLRDKVNDLQRLATDELKVVKVHWRTRDGLSSQAASEGASNASEEGQKRFISYEVPPLSKSPIHPVKNKGNVKVNDYWSRGLVLTPNF
nr:hypothetical protein HmN_000982000 [Hymenolepis microstoma]